MSHRKLLCLVPCLFLALASHAQIDDATKQLSHDIFKQLIEINTTDSVGNVTTAAQAMAQRLLRRLCGQCRKPSAGQADRLRELWSDRAPPRCDP